MVHRRRIEGLRMFRTFFPHEHTEHNVTQNLCIEGRTFRLSEGNSRQVLLPYPETHTQTSFSA